VNLVRDPWLPVVFTEGGRGELGLLEVFARVEEIADVEGDAPHVRVALLRLLVAVLHRALRGPRDHDEWERALWTGTDGFARAASYLEEHEGLFLLLDPDRPFWQCPVLPEERAAPVAALVPSLASGNNRVWFDHTSKRRPARLSLPEAARWLVALQSFDPGGTKTGFPTGNAPSEHAPLAGRAVVMPEGATLARTLALNALLYDPASELPFAGTARHPEADAPVWEREPPPPEAITRAPTGYLDWLTWSSRRVRLVPDRSDRATINRVVITPGDRLSEPYESEDLECFVPQVRGSERQAFAGLRFDPDRPAWRHSAAILARSGTGTPLHRRAEVVNHLDRLVELGKLPRDASLPLVVAGLAVERAKVIAWGEERLQTLARILADEVCGEVLSSAVGVAEELRGSLERAVAEALLPADGARRPRSAVSPIYFALLGLRFEGFLVQVARDPVRAAEQWEGAVRAAVEEAWRHAVPTGTDAVVKRREVRARSELDRQLNRKLAVFRERVEALVTMAGVESGGI
jgi:CRISPR system Cascade subunit CasA